MKTDVRRAPGSADCLPRCPGRAASRAVELVVYAHSLDFGKKAYGNLVELARLQEHVADELGAATGALVVHAKSAHVYEPEWSAMASIVGAGQGAGLR